MKSLKKKTILALSSTLLFGALVGVGAVKEVIGIHAAETTYTFSSFAAGTQYTANEEHVLDNYLTCWTTECHFTSELRIYSSSTHDGYAVFASTKPISAITFNAGNKADTVAIYDAVLSGETWTKGTTQLKSFTTTATAYTDYDVSFDTPVTSFALDVVGKEQVRIKSMAVSYVEDSSKYDITFNAGKGSFKDGKGELISVDAGQSEEVVLPTVDDLLTLPYSNENITATKLVGWNDGTTTHNPGATVNVTAATKFTAVYEVAKSEFTLSEAAAICEIVKNSKTDLLFTVTATVKSIDEAYNSKYKNITITLTDGTTDLGAYRLAGGSTLSVGDVITVTGNLIQFNGTKNQFNSGATYVAVASASDVDTKQQLLLTGHDDGTFTAGTRFAVTVPAALVAANIDRVTGFGFSVSIDGTTYVDVEVAQANVVLNEGAASYAVVIDNIPEAHYATDIKAKAYVSIGTTKVYFNEVGYSVADMVAAYTAAPEGLTAEQVQLLADFAAAYSA